jgi:excinuclease ABC subunit A
MIMAPLIKDRKGEHLGVFEDLRKAGYVRVRVDGKIHDLSEEFDLDKNKRHTIEVVVDRLVIGDEEQSGRISDSVETALKLGAGVVLVSIVEGEELLFSEHFACVHCGISLGEIAPRTFSFNSPHGACSTCTGLGVKLEIDPELVIPNKGLTIAEGAVRPWSRTMAVNTWYASMLESVAHKYGFSINEPVKNLTLEQLDRVLYGSGSQLISIRHETQLGKSYQWNAYFEGVVPNLERRYRETESDYVRAEIERYMRARPCPACEGQRLKPESLSVTIGDW